MDEVWGQRLSPPLRLCREHRPRPIIGLIWIDTIDTSHPQIQLRRLDRAACPDWDSNPDRTDFEAVASANWATGACMSRLAAAVSGTLPYQRGTRGTTKERV